MDLSEKGKKKLDIFLLIIWPESIIAKVLYVVLQSFISKSHENMCRSVFNSNDCTVSESVIDNSTAFVVFTFSGDFTI